MNDLTGAALILAANAGGGVEGEAARAHGEAMVAAFHVAQSKIHVDGTVLPVRVDVPFEGEHAGLLNHLIIDVCYAFGVRAVYNQVRVALIGFQDDIDAAGLMYEHLEPQLLAEFAANGRNRNNKFAATYSATVQGRLMALIMEVPEYDFDLMAKKKRLVEKMVKREFPRTRSGRTAGWSAAGAAAGGAADLGGRRGRVTTGTRGIAA